MNVMSSKNNIKKTLIMSIIINGIIPLIAYKFFMHYMPSITALIIATMIPLADNLYHIIKDKKIDAFAMFILVGFIIGIIAVLLGGNEKFLLLRESFITGILGFIFLISLIFPKPLIYYFAERFSNSDKINKEFLEKRWESPYFRHSIKLITLVWGIALVLEAIIKVVLVFILSISAFLVISNFVSYGIIGLAIFWTISYRKKMIGKLSKQKL